MVLGVLGSALIGVGYHYYGETLIKVAMTVLILLGNIYGMCVLVLLLAYGIAFVPVAIWKLANTEMRLYTYLIEAQDTWFEFRDARLEYMKQVSICHDLITNYRTETNEACLDLLLSELPKSDLEG